MSWDLPTHLLRTLVAVHEAGSLTRAAARLGRSESALSLQMARLEEVAGLDLFQRNGRALQLNQSGVALLGHARRILAAIDAARHELQSMQRLGLLRLGLVQDFAGDRLKYALRQFEIACPDVQMEIVVSRSSDLLQLMSEDRLDVAMCAAPSNEWQSDLVLPMQWLGLPDLASHEILPLAMIEAPCPFLTAATAALDRAGRPFRLMMMSPSLEGVRACVEAGTALTCRTAMSLPGTDRLGRESGLPDLPCVSYKVMVHRQASPASREMAKIIRNKLLEEA